MKVLENKELVGTMRELHEKGKVIPGKYDPVFKALFEKESMRGILAYIISEITKIQKEYIIEHLVIKNTNIPKKKYMEKGKTADFVVEIKDHLINLEMNTYVKKGVLRKNIEYHYALAGGITKIKENSNKKVIQINFNIENIFDDREIIEFKLRDEKGTQVLDENFINYQVNMEKILKLYYNNVELTRLEKILVMLQLEDKRTLKNVAKGDSELEDMGEFIEEFSYDDDIIGLYDKEAVDKYVHDLDVEEGFEKGIEQGTEQKTNEIALNMLKDRVEIETISKYTGLSTKEIENLK